jgi:hypothetical protein
MIFLGTDFERLTFKNIMNKERFKTCIDACNACATACEHCAAADLKEEQVKMLIDCILMDLECSTICRATVKIMTINGKFADQMCAICAQACDACATECEKHIHMEHCKTCAEQCRKCAGECRKMAA